MLLQTAGLAFLAPPPSAHQAHVNVVSNLVAVWALPPQIRQASILFWKLLEARILIYEDQPLLFLFDYHFL